MLESAEREKHREDSLQRRISANDFARLRALRPICLRSVGSTQDFLSKDLQSHREGDFVVSRVQSSGRGRHGRFWHSDTGGLYVSLTLIPRGIRIEGLTGVLAESVLQTLDSDFQLSGCEIKPPNDVLCNRKKISGVLADAVIQGSTQIVYCGLGVNLNNCRDWDEAMLRVATSFKNETGRSINEDDFLMALLKRLDANFSNSDL